MLLIVLSKKNIAVLEITAKIAINAKKIKNIYLIRVLDNKKLNYIIKNKAKNLIFILIYYLSRVLLLFDEDAYYGRVLFYEFVCFLGLLPKVRRRTRIQCNLQES